jgi:hypothetical protein
MTMAPCSLAITLDRVKTSALKLSQMIVLTRVTRVR